MYISMYIFKIKENGGTTCVFTFFVNICENII